MHLSYLDNRYGSTNGRSPAERGAGRRFYPPWARRCAWALAALLLLFLPGGKAVFAGELSKVAVQLNWKHQFQFAGFYAAKEKGFYEEGGLDVTLRELDPGKSALGELLSRRANYGVWGSGWILDRIRGVPLVMLSNYLKHSALVLMCDPSIASPDQLAGKKIMATAEEQKLPEIAYLLKRQGVDPARVSWRPHSFRAMDIFEGKTDAMTAYVTNQPFELDKRGIRYSILDPANYGADFYGESLYTSEEELRRHPGRTRRFVWATIRGWEYALANPGEIIDLILKKYTNTKSREALEFEARGIVRLMLPATHPVGAIDPARIRRITDTFVEQGMAPEDYDLSGFAYDAAKGEVVSIRATDKVLLADFRVRPPHMFIRHNSPHGPMVTLIEEMAGRLGYKVEWQFRPFHRSFRDLVTGKTDIVPRVFRTLSREAFAHFLGPIAHETKTVRFIVPEGQTEHLTRYEDLGARRIGVKKDAFYFKRFNRDEKLAKTAVPEDQELATLFGKGIVDTIAVYDHELLDRALADQGIQKYAYAQYMVSEKIGVYFALSRHSPLASLHGPLNEMLAAKVAGGKVADLYASYAPKMMALSAEESAFLRNNPVITVANEDDWPPFDFSVGGQPQGFSIDLVNLLAERIGVHLKYVNGYSWDELVRMFYARQIDVIHALNRTEERKEYGLFTRAYYHDRHVLVSRADSGPLGFDFSLSGKVLAFPAGFALADHFRREHPEAKVMTLSNVQEVLEAISSGKAFGTVEQERVADYFIAKYGFRNLRISEIPEGLSQIKPSPMHIAVRKDWPVLHGLFVKALSTVTPAEIEALQRKWFGDEGAKEGKKNSVGLTEQERAHLAALGEITFSIPTDWMPFGAVKEGRLQGMAADFIQLFSSRTGVPFRHIAPEVSGDKETPAGTHRIDLLPMVNPAGDTFGDLTFTKPYLHYTDAIIVREEMPFITGLADIQRKRIGIASGNGATGNFVARRHPGIGLTKFSSVREGLLSVSSGKLDAFLVALPVATYTIQEMGLTNLKVAGHVEAEKALAIGVVGRQLPLHGIMEKVVTSLTRREIDAIYRKWVSVRFEHQVDYTLVWEILAATAVVLLGFTYWNRKLARLNRKIAEAHERLGEKSLELEQLSQTDRLTGLYNRMKLDTVLEREFRRSRRYGGALSFILLDVDRFKSVNDTFGHQAGDVVLRHMADLLMRHVRKTDTVGRWGGEEFMVICPGTDLEGARILADKLRIHMAARPFPAVGKVTASFGVALCGEDAEEAMRSADRALYAAKNGGRNRVETAP